MIKLLSLIVACWLLPATNAAAQTRAGDSTEILTGDLRRTMHVVDSARHIADSQSRIVFSLQQKVGDAKYAVHVNRKKLALLEKDLHREQGRFDDILIYLDSSIGVLNDLKGRLEKASSPRL